VSALEVKIDERVELPDHAREFAEKDIERVRNLFVPTLPIAGMTATNSSNEYLFNLEKEVEDEVAKEGFMLFARFRTVEHSLYPALLEGYNPTPEQREVHGGFNFLYREILELHYEHTDIEASFSKYGYNSELTPVNPPYSGALILPETLVFDSLGVLFERGRLYKEEFGWSFPDWSGTYDEVTGERIDNSIEITGGAEAMK